MSSQSFEHLIHAGEAATIVMVGKLGLALAVYAAILIGGRVLANLLHRAAKTYPGHGVLITILARAAWVGAVILGALSALQNLGIDVTAFIASLGLAGLTLGFALRDVVTSFVAGLLIVAYKPFARGDRITVQGVEGTVTAIDLRYTALEGDGRSHLVPNSAILTNPVTVIHRIGATETETTKP